MNWAWLLKSTILAVHEMQLAEHGGASGLREGGLLHSALARPENLAVYETPDVASLAAAYASGIIRNHPFIDGNKRTGYVAMETFLELNGWELSASDAEAVVMALRLAASEVTDEEFAAFIRTNLCPR